MLPKGLLWIILGFVTVTTIVLLAFFVNETDKWCNELLSAGDCEMHMPDETCFCIEEGSSKQQDQELGLFENAQAVCEQLNGTLATPEQRDLLIWLSKRMFIMGVDLAFIGLRKIHSEWYWLESDGHKVAQNMIWRPDFPEIPEQTYGMITVETVRKETEEEYLMYNYDHYLEKDKTYQWFGLTTSDNTDDRLRGIYHICHYVSKPEVPEVEATTPAPTVEINTDPCYCAAREDVFFENRDQSSMFTSPRYPADYCSDTNCRWIVKTVGNLVVKLQWIVFNLEKNMDFVYIYDGETDGIGSGLLDTCTSSRCTNQVSSGNAMQVHFKSDHVTTDLGFKFRVTAIDPVEMANPGESYTLLSPNYPDPYCDNKIHNCSWTVVAPNGYGLEMLWKNKQTNEQTNLQNAVPYKPSSDVIFVYDDSSPVQENELMKCSGDSCENVITSGESLHIKFQSDGKHSASNAPFSAVITVVQNFCERNKLESSLMDTVTYSETREDDNIPLGSSATLTCPNSTKIEKTIDTTEDTVKCIAPYWERQFKICKEACIVNVSLSHDIPYKNMSLCQFKMNKMTGLVTPGDTVEVTHKDFVNDHQLSAPIEHKCEGMEWTNGVPLCHVSGIIVMDGVNDYHRPIGAIDLYSPAQHSLIPLRMSLITPRQGHGSVLFDKCKAIVMGGKSDDEALEDEALDNTEIIDLISGQVSNGPKLMQSREYLAAANLNGNVIACGGMGFHFQTLIIFPSCESYQVGPNKWSSFAQMTTPRAHFGLVVLNGCLYAVAGQTHTHFPSIFEMDGSISTERYCSQSWEMRANMKTPRAAHGTAVFGQKIVACGGWLYGYQEINDCEMYLPQEDQWHTIAGLNQDTSNRLSLLMVTYGGKLLVLGGGEEEYDPKNNKWIIKNYNFIAKDFSSSVIIG